jgi:3-dehydroquinate synthase
MNTSISVTTSPTYTIQINPKLLSTLSETLKPLCKGSQIGIVTHPSLNHLYGETLSALLKQAGWTVHTLIVPEGESSKSLPQITHLLDELLVRKFERIDSLIALGGGVIGDLTGFLASIYLRGIPFVQIPTSLLAQVDAAIGGKTGINHERGKNLIGSFYQPKSVLIDPETLKTLPARELKNGLAEVIKYGVIYSPALFEQLEKNVSTLTQWSYASAPELWTDLIIQSAQCKAKVVSEDEKESHLREILNFGHTIAHAIEAVFEYGTYHHGEAVALGMIGAGRIAVKLNMWSDAQQKRLETLIQTLEFDTQIQPQKASDLMEIMTLDKKVREGKVRFILPTAFGQVIPRSDIDSKLIIDTLVHLGATR